MRAHGRRKKVRKEEEKEEIKKAEEEEEEKAKAAMKIEPTRIRRSATPNQRQLMSAALAAIVAVEAITLVMAAVAAALKRAIIAAALAKRAVVAAAVEAVVAAAHVTLAAVIIATWAAEAWPFIMAAWMGFLMAAMASIEGKMTRRLATTSKTEVLAQTQTTSLREREGKRKSRRRK